MIDAVAPTPPNVPANWYPDPNDSPRQRYWDGSAWTEHFAPLAPALPQEPDPFAAGKKNGWAVASLILGIIALVAASIPSEQWLFRVLIAALGLAFGIVGIVTSRRRGRVGMSIWGLCLNGIALVVGIVMTISIVSANPTGGTVDRASVQEQLSSALAKKGFTGAKILCPQDRPLKAGTSFECGYTLSDGSTGVIKVKIQDDQGTFIWQVEP